MRFLLKFSRAMFNVQRSTFDVQRSTLIFVVALGLFMVVGASYFIHFLLNPFQFSSSQEIVYTIKPGDSLRDVAQSLAENHSLRTPYFFTAFAIVKGASRQLKAGEYAFSSSISVPALLNLFIKGKVKQHRLTLIPGWTFEEVLQALYQAHFLIHTTKGLSQEAIWKKIGIQELSGEGLLFPDTYFFTQGTEDCEVLKKAYQSLQDRLQELWQARSSALPYQTPYEGLILASLVEKETAREEERSKIAGVFIRRLKKDMKLESDPTIIYGMGDRYKGILLKRHLTYSSPYNTYLHKGLPPAPIALVGRASLQAAFYPDSGTDLYFVADRKGGHSFSRSWHEHEKTVKLYQWKKDNS